jgi:hypothetical protein
MGLYDRAMPPRRRRRQTTESQIDATVGNTPQSQRGAAIVEALHDRVVESGDDLDWIQEVARISSTACLPVTELRRITDELAWLARGVGQRLPADPDYQRCDEANSHLGFRTMAYVHGQRLRADFRFLTLYEASRVWLRRLPDDGMIRALAAFGALGGRRDGASRVLDRAISSPDSDRHCRLVCLHGLWFATHLSDQSERMLELSDEIIGRSEDGHSVHYWRASALRRLGRLDEALTSVDHAIEALPVGFTEWHQDYVRERELVTSTQFLTDHIQRESTIITERLRGDLDARVKDLQSEIERQSSQARDLVSSSLVNLIEVLGLFVAIAGFLIASGLVVWSTDDLWQSLAATALLLGGALSFFVLLRFTVRFRSHRG